MSRSFAQDTTFAIEKIVQNAYIDSSGGLPPTYFNSVFGESMSSLVAVNETVSGVIYRKLYLAYVTDISFTSIDTVSGNIAIARFDENLKLEFDKIDKPNFLIPSLVYKCREESYRYWELS